MHHHLRPLPPIDAGTNLDAPMDTGADPGLRIANIRFRHLKNTSLNALMADGHIQSFRYNARMKSEILRRNVKLPLP